MVSNRIVVFDVRQKGGAIQLRPAAVAPKKGGQMPPFGLRLKRPPTKQTAAPSRSKPRPAGRAGRPTPRSDEIKAVAIAAETRDDHIAAATAWATAREMAPNTAEATCREIELLLVLKNYEAAHVRLFTALQKFSNEPK